MKKKVTHQYKISDEHITTESTSRMQQLLTLVMVLVLSGCIANDLPEEKTATVSHMNFPCLSYTLPCGELSVRPPQKISMQGALNGDRERGKEAAFTKSQGNCLACHNMAGGIQPGNRGPDLSHYAETGRSDEETYSLIYDMRWRNPDTVMPPMGTNEILSDQEIRDIVAFLQSSK